jgi:3-oxoacyl-[acyl-carrier-protein] synthase III
VTSLEAVSVYLPDSRLPVEELADELQLTSMQMKLFKRFNGLAEVCREPARTLPDLLLAGADGLAELRGREHQVRYVLHARTMPVVVPYPVNPVHGVCRALGLEHATAFTVSHHACATGLLAIDIAGRLLRADGDRDALALILTGEKAFTRDAQLVPGSSIFAEASAACLVTADGPRDRVLAYAVSIRGEFNGRIEEDPELAFRYAEEYQTTLAETILAAVAKAGLRLDEISLILPHNVNLPTWKRLGRAIGFPADRILLDNVPLVGHAFCADSFLNYRTAVDRGLLRPGDRYLIAAAGLGATFSAMIFEH